MPMPGFMELVLIFGVVFLLFGAKKLPALGGAIGESIRNFKKGIKEDESEKKQIEGGEGNKSSSSNDQNRP